MIEDLNVAGLVRNRRLARAISDCGWASSHASSPANASGTAAPGRDRSLVFLVQDLLGVQVPARGAEPFHPALDVSLLRHPA